MDLAMHKKASGEVVFKSMDEEAFAALGRYMGGPWHAAATLFMHVEPDSVKSVLATFAQMGFNVIDVDAPKPKAKVDSSKFTDF